MNNKNLGFAVIYVLTMLLAAGLTGLIQALPPAINVQVRMEITAPGDCPKSNQVLVNPIYWPNKNDRLIFALSAPKIFFGVF
ncbi:MAG: hypothetical protein A3J65_02380 [Candidatus Buchananbacteria bacterium RIFCSPHIGHO2_02_FULL_45_11b]|uniref:Uncharacterized protein n=3 Tax=Candidatus Buchananiibacteriota TaxID=1817903 RepID=A0A1G1Y4X3_9BACT|nr:MAG: hypothetical protein A2663_00915 [Candidatus Buchananbacteria bacterium RIFCSPHIGHO2_01_FULL_46_12]OGY51697.1 MAG: hypothetical protein A3J65_02380 [Candidatus Buchananbacteria bacterium RIFCSPHIGHO2_02_FULL_45_11b]OGY57856.1 MAG: hypothetical protein A3H67_03165 [Candidatus Buchananbacteria bacterium RIFCSPLOWO2_02_FULL_46_11b]